MRGNEPLTSIVLPVQNLQHELEKLALHTLELIAELCPSFELLIIDHGSTDATIEQADHLASQYPQIRPIFQHEPQLAAALRNAIQQCRGETIGLVVDPPRLGNRSLRQVWQMSEQYPVVMLAGRGGQAHSATGVTVADRVVFILSRRNILETILRKATDADLAEKGWVQLIAEHGFGWYMVRAADATCTGTSGLPGAHIGRTGPQSAGRHNPRIGSVGQSQ